MHPYDDAAVIAGQGTVGLEMLAPCRTSTCLVVPIGGGGLISGIATAAQALQAGDRGHRRGDGPVSLESRVSAPADLPVGRRRHPRRGHRGEAPRRRSPRDRRRLVTTCCSSRRATSNRRSSLLLEIEKTVAEGAGARGTGGVLRHPARLRGASASASSLCGGNIDPLVLADVLMRGLVRDGRLARIRVTTRDRSGRTGARGDADRRGRRQHRGSGAPAGLHHAACSECGTGVCPADARARAHRGSPGHAARRGPLRDDAPVLTAAGVGSKAVARRPVGLVPDHSGPRPGD